LQHGCQLGRIEKARLIADTKHWHQVLWQTYRQEAAHQEGLVIGPDELCIIAAQRFASSGRIMLCSSRSQACGQSMSRRFASKKLEMEARCLSVA